MFSHFHEINQTFGIPKIAQSVAVTFESINIGQKTYQNAIYIVIDIYACPSSMAMYARRQTYITSIYDHTVKVDILDSGCVNDQSFYWDFFRREVVALSKGNYKVE